MKLWRLAFILILMFCIHPLFAETFKNGDVVCFLGDSITHAGNYEYNIYNFYLTRHPDWKIECYNCGVGGDTAGGALRRLDEDLFIHRPNQITIMLGMNDFGLWAYAENPTKDQLAAQKRGVDHYRKNFDILVKTLKSKSNAKLTFITPSPYDHTGVNDRNNNHPGANNGLAACSEFLKEYAVQNNVPLVDFNGPMAQYNLEQQKSDPRFTIIGPDRVHPGAPGHLMMAWLFLKAQKVSPIVSHVILDAKGKNVLKCENADLSALNIQASSISFDLHEKALPFPFPSGCSDLLKQLPLAAELSQELLQIKNLVPGNYELKIDDSSIGKYSAEQLNTGIDLSLTETTPQFKQAQQVRLLSDQRRMAEMNLREFAALRWFLQPTKINLDDLTEVKNYYETKMAGGYFKTLVPHYLERWDKKEEYRADFMKKDQAARAAAKTVSHKYSLVKIIDN